jgi:uncharacterized protein (DUF3084 family)
MNTMIAFPVSKPELKLASHSTPPHPQAEERRRMDDDIEALRLREANLREYETHLRDWQEQIERGQAQSPAPRYAAPAPLTRLPAGTPEEGEQSLHTAWDKLIRARELLEAEQAHLRDDRLNLKENAAVLKRREDALALREARLAQREEQFSATIDAAVAEQTKSSALARFTQAPFAMAKSVFGGKSKPE